MSGSHDHLVYMANQIARNFAVMGDVDAAKATADHIASFWEARMKAAEMSQGTKEEREERANTLAELNKKAAARRAAGVKEEKPLAKAEFLAAVRARLDELQNQGTLTPQQREQFGVRQRGRSLGEQLLARARVAGNVFQRHLGSDRPRRIAASLAKDLLR